MLGNVPQFTYLISRRTGVHIQAHTFLCSPPYWGQIILFSFFKISAALTLPTKPDKGSLARQRRTARLQWTLEQHGQHCATYWQIFFFSVSTDGRLFWSVPQLQIQKKHDLKTVFGVPVFRSFPTMDPKYCFLCDAGWIHGCKVPTTAANLLCKCQRP